MIRSSFLFAVQQYKSWLLSPRTLLAVYLSVFLYDSVTKGILGICSQTGYVINIAEPLAVILTKSVYAAIIPIVFIALMSDFPKTEGSIFYVYRMSRSSWIFGEIIFAVFSSLTYIFSLMACTAIYCMGHCSFNNLWSDYTTKLYLEFPQIYAFNTSLTVVPSVYTQGRPWEVIFRSIMLMFLYTMILSLLIMLFKLIGKGEAGVVLGIALTLFGFASDSGASPMMWIFPITHTVYGWHFDQFFRKQFFSLTASYIYLISVFAVLLAVDLILSKKARL